MLAMTNDNQLQLPMRGIYKSVFSALLCVYILSLGFIAWHLNNKPLFVLFGVAALVYLIRCIVTRGYFLLLIFLVSCVVFFSRVYNPYTSYIIGSGVVENRVPYEGGEIFIIRFSDNSVVTVVRGDDKRCFGEGYEGKYVCQPILSMLDNFIKTGRWELASWDNP